MGRRKRTNREVLGASSNGDGKSQTVLTCEKCGKRLARVFSTDVAHRGVVDGWDGFLYTPHDEPALVPGSKPSSYWPDGQPDIDHEDWHSITCPRCQHNVQVRDHRIRALALSNPGKSIALTGSGRESPRRT